VARGRCATRSGRTRGATAANIRAVVVGRLNYHPWRRRDGRSAWCHGVGLEARRVARPYLDGATKVRWAEVNVDAAPECQALVSSAPRGPRMAAGHLARVACDRRCRRTRDCRPGRDARVLGTDSDCRPDPGPVRDCRASDWRSPWSGSCAAGRRQARIRDGGAFCIGRQPCSGVTRAAATERPKHVCCADAGGRTLDQGI